MGIEYPQLIKDHLDGDGTEVARLRGALDTTRALFSAWMETSKLPFFPDYTDHGSKHLSSVLRTCVELMPEEARDLITPADAAILSLAVFLHDSAMHLSKGGLEYLIHGAGRDRRVDGFDDTPWHQLWDEFIFQARRWDDRRLRDVLGETKDEQPIASVRNPFDSYDDLKETDERLLGEFIRGHHPRMAHEFAVYGVPSDSGNPIQVDDGFRDDERYIAGLIARSHGVPLRGCAEMYRNRYSVAYRGIHAAYLMALLRVGDYLQIEESRAPRIVFQYRSFPSPVSVLEHRTHQAVDDVDWDDDPESITVTASPGDVHAFLNLKKWLTGIQHELDASWAVLGETYGPRTRRGLDKLGLEVRRVRSNLDDDDRFVATKEPEYVPQRIELAVARPELLRVLVRPLYGDDPSYGVRELTQNAVDAVRERWVLEQMHEDIRALRTDDEAPDVVIRIDDESEDGATFTIVDQGVGMTLDVIRDYFLTAGASFRDSDAWHRDFAQRPEGGSRVLRSGRFGVGALAGFLLGNEMEVSTRHARAREGYRFRVALDNADPIAVRRAPDLPVGTSISVRVSPATVAELRRTTERVAAPPRAEWYLYDKPAVVRYLSRSGGAARQRRSVPADVDGVPAAGARVQGTAGYEVYCVYDDLPALSVNGIHVTDAADHRGWQGTNLRNVGADFSLFYPNLCVVDPDADLPLGLKRSDTLEGRIVKDEDVLDTVMDDMLAHYIAECPTTLPLSTPVGLRRYRGLRGPQIIVSGILTEYVGLCLWAGPAGIAPIEALVTREAGLRSALVRLHDQAPDGRWHAPRGEGVWDSLRRGSPRHDVTLWLADRRYGAPWEDETDMLRGVPLEGLLYLDLAAAVLTGRRGQEGPDTEGTSGLLSVTGGRKISGMRARDMVKSCVWASGGFLGWRDFLGDLGSVLEDDSSHDIG